VACAGGELVSLNADASAITRSLKLGRDLRDIVPMGEGRLAISRFRAAAITVVDADGNVTMEKMAQAAPGHEAAVGYRMRATSEGVVMLH
jgi:hypothetical protein